MILRIGRRFIGLGILALVGCASTVPLTDQAAVNPQETKESLQGLSNALTELGDNKLLSAINKDADVTLAWVASQEAATPPMSPLKAFRAKQCPTAVKMATQDLQEKLRLIQGLITQVDTQIKGLDNQPGPQVIYFFTRLRYGPPGPLGNPQELMGKLKGDVTERVTAVLDSCRAIIPLKQIDELFKVAKKAGLAVGTGGAAAPFLGIIP